MINRSIKLNSVLTRCINLNNTNSIKRSFLLSSSVRSTFIINNNNNSLINKRSYSTETNKDTKTTTTTTTTENENPLHKVLNDVKQAPVDRKAIIQKYQVDESASHKDFTDRGYEVVFYSRREAIFKNLRLLFTGQIALTSVVPIGFLLKGSDIKYTMFGCMLVAWSTSFYFIGKMLMSNFIIRLYHKKGENFIYVVQYAPSARVLKIPIADIKPSQFNPDGTPFMLLESNQLFFFERDGILKNRDQLEYILSGEEFDYNLKSKEEAEYNEHISKSFENAQKNMIDNIGLDEKLKSLEQELKSLKEEEEEKVEDKKQK